MSYSKEDWQAAGSEEKAWKFSRFLLALGIDHETVEEYTDEQWNELAAAVSAQPGAKNYRSPSPDTRRLIIIRLRPKPARSN